MWCQANEKTILLKAQNLTILYANKHKIEKEYDAVGVKTNKL
jgi:hypothetical protein